MTLMRWNAYSPVADLFDDMFGDKSKEKMEQRKYDCSPATNILEKNDSFEIQVALPGVKKEDVTINLEKNVLNITSDKEAEQQQEGSKFTRREFVNGTFCRSFTLPDTIDTENITADVREGILKIGLPKKAETKVSKEIKIS